jgi:lipid A ethanolaminephosphotransferase
MAAVPTATLNARPFAVTPVRRLELSVEALLLVASGFWLLVSNRKFLDAALAGREWSDPTAWGLAVALAVAVTAVHVLMLAPVANRWTVKPLLAVMFVVTAFATHFMEQFGVFLDPSMLRNVMRTDVREAGELFSLSLLPHLLLYAGLPLLLLSRVRIRQRSLGHAVLVRLAFIASALLVLAASLLAVYQPLSSLMRQQKEVRYLITPANLLWSTSSVFAAEAKGAAQPRRAIGLDAVPGPSWAQRNRPSVLVLVVGETARAANWGLSGYERQTTPRLAGLPVVNFADVTSCGTNTETSVPCLFAPVGRRQYDEAGIRGSEGLLHVLARAGVAVQWRDNQSGCKGVCEGLPALSAAQTAAGTPACAGGHCLDEALLHGLDERLKSAQGHQVLVLHMLGNHGPSYFRRYPPAFAKFQPACEKDDLRQCSREQIVNAYDNALLYTDELLARLVETLRASAVDTAMLYVSDHGESLGENNLYLHGVPYAIAPRVQTQVPMVMWASDGWRESAGLDLGCLQQRAKQPAAHDHVFHTVLGLMDVRTSLYEPAWDLTAGCRKPG